MIIDLIQVLNTIASLALISLGLAVIFGMMKVMNFAHGEFLMLGAFAMQIAATAGVNIWVAMFVVAPLVVGLIGVVVERLVIRHLYGRLMDTLLATWGLSLFFIGLATMLFGTMTRGVSVPVGSFEIGGIRDSGYKFVVIGVTLFLFVALYLLLKKTRAGLIARATMDNPAQVAALGVNPGTVYAATFGIGAAISGLAGAMMAPLTGVLPTIGAAYIGKAFITVIGGGEAILAGTAAASSLFGTINQIVSIQLSPEFGEMALLIGALIVLRFLPQGMSGLFRRRLL